MRILPYKSDFYGLHEWETMGIDLIYKLIKIKYDFIIAHVRYEILHIVHVGNELSVFSGHYW